MESFNCPAYCTERARRPLSEGVEGNHVEPRGLHELKGEAESAGRPRRLEIDPRQFLFASCTGSQREKRDNRKQNGIEMKLAC